MGENAQTQLARNHDPQKQFVHLLGKVLLRWLASFILAAMMVVAFYEYEKVKILNTTSKRWFNAVSTGLYLTLGLNLAASLKGMAIIVRWKLLARKRHQLEEVSQPASGASRTRACTDGDIGRFHIGSQFTHQGVSIWVPRS